MREIIKIYIVAYTSPTQRKKYMKDLFSFCKAAQIPLPEQKPSITEDCYEIDITNQPERKALLWLHILSDLAMLVPHFVVEYRQLESYRLFPDS